MSTPFQNRLVGTIIVAAVVIIFLPDLLDGEKKSYQAEFEAIPTADAFNGEVTSKPFPEKKLVRQKIPPISSEVAIDSSDAMPQKLPTPIEDITKNVTAKNTIVAKNIKKESITLAKPNSKLQSPEYFETQSMGNRLPEKAIAKEAWVIHLGSFRNKKNVEQLLKKLKDNGYVFFTSPIKTKQGMLTKVIIGPELIKSSMVKKLPALKKLTGIEGKVAYFNVKR